MKNREELLKILQHETDGFQASSRLRDDVLDAMERAYETNKEEELQKIEKFIRYNEKMNSSLITDWSRDMILKAICVYVCEQDKKLLL